MTSGGPRSHPVLRVAAGALITVLVALSTVLFAPPAIAGGCSAGAGVTVVVDATVLGAGISTGCAAGDPTTGTSALDAAGYQFGYVPRQPGLICTINERPNPCNGAQQTAYWSYWHAQPGGKWVYSNAGAGSYDPAPGSVEGWAFGAGTAPRIAPPAAAVPVTTRTVAPPPTTPSTRTTAPTTQHSTSSAAPTARPTPVTTSRRTTTSPSPVTMVPTRSTVAPPRSETQSSGLDPSPTSADLTSTRPSTSTPRPSASSPAPATLTTRSPTTPARPTPATTARATRTTAITTTAGSTTSPTSSVAANPTSIGSPSSPGPSTDSAAILNTAQHTGSGSYWGLILGGAVIVVIALAAVLRARRSRS